MADLDRKIAELRAKQAAQEKKGDPVLRELRKLQRSLKRFTQFALDHNRPDIANSTLGFRTILERLLEAELTPRSRPPQPDEDD